MIMNFGIFISFLITSSTVFGAICSNPVVRKEIRELTINELRAFTSAINELKRQPSPQRPGLSRYEYFTYIHNTWHGSAHTNPAFLPWHRVFIRLWEQELQSINPNIVIPYWDWSIDSENPHNSPIFSERMFGGNGRGRDECVANGPFSNFQVTIPNRHCLRRRFNQGNRLGRFPSTERILLNLNENSFSKFSYQFERLHGTPHAFIGGGLGDLYYMYSPNDPIFFIHHVFVDMIYDKWLKQHPNSRYEGNSYQRGRNAKLTDRLIPFNFTVQQVTETREDFFCYAYPSYPRLISNRAVPSRTRSRTASLASTNPTTKGIFKSLDIKAAIKALSTRLSSIRPHTRALFQSISPLPDSYIKINGLDIKEVREAEAEDSKLISLLNKIPNFVSFSELQATLNSYY